ATRTRDECSGSDWLFLGDRTCLWVGAVAPATGEPLTRGSAPRSGTVTSFLPLDPLDAPDLLAVGEPARLAGAWDHEQLVVAEHLRPPLPAAAPKHDRAGPRPAVGAPPDQARGRAGGTRAGVRPRNLLPFP